MKITSVSTSSLLGFRDGARSLTNPSTGLPHPVVAITGPRSSGKTSFMEAILAAKEGIAPYGRRTTRQWSNGVAPAVVGIDWLFDDTERDFAGLDDARVATETTLGKIGAPGAPGARGVGVFALLDRYRHDASAGKLDYHAVDRSIPRTALSPTGSVERDQRFLRLTRDPGKYAALTRYLVEVELRLRPNATRAVFGELFAKLTTTARFVGATMVEGPTLVFENAWGKEITSAELSESERDAMVFAGTAAMIGLSRSILFVDRPELFQTPSTVVSFVDGLRSLGHDLQVFLATSSAEILATLPKGAILELDATGGRS